MLHPSTKMLINKLSEMTRKQRVAWDEGENGQIIHDTEGYRVILSPAPHTVMLTDVLGKEIETCTPEEIAAEAETGGRPYSQFVSELYREASRHARGTERAIDAVLRGLDREEEGESSESFEEHDVPTIQLEESESVEDLTDESDPSDFEALHLTDDEPTLTSEEIEGETEMTRAIEAMAEEVNGPETDEAEMAEDETSDITVPVFGATSLREAEFNYDTADTLVDDVSREPAADFLSEESSQKFDQIESAIPPQYAESEETADPILTPEPSVAPAGPAGRVTPMGGAGFFGSSLGDLSRYRTQQMTDKISVEENTEQETTTPVTEHEVEASAPDTSEEFSVETDPAPSEAIETQPEARKFSLSGLTSGFGMGTPANVTPAEEVASATQVSTEPPKMIDGTIDLPDFPPAEPTLEEAPSPVLPSFDQPLTPPAPEVDNEASKEWIVRDESSAPAQVEVEAEKPETKAKKPTPFNPWN